MVDQSLDEVEDIDRFLNELRYMGCPVERTNATDQIAFSVTYNETDNIEYLESAIEDVYFQIRELF